MTVELFRKSYRKKADKMVYHIAKDNKEFEKVYNNLQDQLKALGGRDELLCGKYSVLHAILIYSVYAYSLCLFDLVVTMV